MIRLNEPSPFELYLPEGPGPFPLICFTPILGRLAFWEDFFLERRLSRFFARQGFATALIERPIFEFNPARGLEQIQGYLEESVARNKKVLDFLMEEKKGSTDPARIGSYGMSFGAVVNALWAASDPRPKAHVFSLIGGNIPEIILTSRDPLMRNYLQAIQMSRGKDGLKPALQQAIRSEPLKVCRSIPRENVLMFLAIFDRVIRFRYGLALRQVLGKPETVFLPLGHYTSILTIPLLKWKVISFFKKKLNR